jgi:biopolymer transport protein ExbB
MNNLMSAIQPLAQGMNDAAADQGGEMSSISILEHFVLQGGWITLFVLIPLSIVTIALTLHYLLTVRSSVHTPQSLAEALLMAAKQGQFKKIMSVTAQNETMLGQAAHAGLSGLSDGRDNARAAIDEVVEEKATNLFRRIEYLNVIGNVSPMIGLLGTVYGMIHAFSRIFAAGGGMPDAGKLAGDISVALVTTFWGILIAIPALTAHALFRNRIDGFAADCVKTCEQLVSLAGSGQRAKSQAQRHGPAEIAANQMGGGAGSAKGLSNE